MGDPARTWEDALMIRLRLPLAVSLALLAAGSGLAQTIRTVPARETGPGRLAADAAAEQLFAILRHQTAAETDVHHIDEFIQQLGDPDYQRRERASGALVVIGRAALEHLRSASGDTDLEIGRRARACMDAIETALDKSAGYFAVLGLLRHRPPGTAEALLEYLPEADAETAEEIWQGITAVAVRDGTIDVDLRSALEDKAPPRRALAALLLGRYGGEEHRAAVRKCLSDTDPDVRLRAAQGLLAAREKGAVPVLIGLLQDAPLDLAWQAEELLRWLAGMQAPEALVGSGGTRQREKCRAAWQAWWRAEETRLDWASRDRDNRRPGLVLLCEPSRVWLCGCDGKTRWEITGLESPNAVQELPGPRFLVLEPYAARLTERDAGGKIVWQVDRLTDDGYVNAQRLPNGNTFLASMEQFVEYGRDGKVVNKVDVTESTDGDVSDAVKLRSGAVVVRLPSGVAELDGVTGSVLRGSTVNNLRPVHNGHMAVLPNGNCLLADPRRQRVVELDLAGNIVWEHGAGVVAAVAGLRNGNVLVATQREHWLFEMTRDGRCVWEAPLNGQPIRIRTTYNRVRLGFDGPRSDDLDLNSVANRIGDLRGGNPAVRRHAASALAAYGPEAKAAVTPLIEVLDDGNSDVNGTVVNALVRIGVGAQPALVKALHHDAPRVRTGAWAALTNMGAAAKPVLPDLLAILGDPKEELAARQASARAIAAMGATGAEAVPSLLAQLSSDNDAMRYAAAQALPSVGATNADAVKALAAALKDAKFPEGERGAAEALRTLGSRAAPAVPDILAVCESGTYTGDVRAAAVRALATMETEARPAVRPLVDLLADGGHPEKVRVAAAETLGALRLEGKVALSTLNEILRDPNLPPALSGEGAKALTRMGPEGIQVLTLLVNEGNPKAKLAAIQALSTFGEAAKSAMPALVQAANQDKDAEVRQGAGRAINVIQAGGGRGRGKVLDQ
jgi:HEAT repeat protein